MKKISLPGFDEQIEVYNWVNYIVLQPSGVICGYSAKPEQDEDGFYRTPNGIFAEIMIPARIWGIRSTVPPVIGHKFQLRNGFEFNMVNGGAAWDGCGKHKEDDDYDLIEDLGPISPVNGPGWYVSRDGRLIQVWTVEAPIKNYPVRGCIRLTKCATDGWVEAAWDCEGAASTHRGEGSDIVRQAFIDEISKLII